MGQLQLTLGSLVSFNDTKCVITRIVSADLLSIQEVDTGIFHTVKASLLSPLRYENEFTFTSLNEKQLIQAKKRHEIIKPLLGKRLRENDISYIIQTSGFSRSTLFRWVKAFTKNSTIMALAPQSQLGGRGKSRLSTEIDSIIYKYIASLYLSRSRKSINKVIRSIKIECIEKNLKIPADTTIRARIKNISEEEILKARYGKKKSDEKFEMVKGNFPGGNFPLHDVQMDHTKLDILLVDEITREPIGRPYLTIAIDVYSRMIIGYHLSFDQPSERETGICIANSILGKEQILSKFDINETWPCFGVMNNLHLDNAKEFRGSMLKEVAPSYNITICHRPVGAPRYSGHVERWFRTFNNFLHDLDGTTFSNIFVKSNYDSKGQACFTIDEFEKMFVIYITSIYHNSVHTSIGMTPLQKYTEIIVETQAMKPRLTNERMVRLDFMPHFYRTIQQEGVVFRHIHYYIDIFKYYVHRRENNSLNSPIKKYMFKYDPRDLSCIHFYNDETDDYIMVPYRNTLLPPINRRQVHKAEKRLKENDTPINEENIFKAFRKIEEIEIRAKQNTIGKKKTNKNNKTSIKNDNIEKLVDDQSEFLDFKNLNITPFKILEYGKFK